MRNLAKFVVAATAVAVTVPDSASAFRAPSAQKITLTLESKCKDGVIDQAKNEESCRLTLVVSPRTPNRSFTLQQVPPGGKKWEDVSKFKSISGTAKVTISGYEEDEESGDEAFRDGRYSFRVVAIRTAKEKAYTSSTFRITFNPDDSFDDTVPDDGSSGTTNTTAPKSTTTVPSSTPPSTTNGGTPTNTTVPASSDPNWFRGVNVSDLGGFCDPIDSVYVGATICSAVATPKSLAQFTDLLSPLTNAMPSFRRSSFCLQALGVMGAGLTFEQRKARCAEANAPSF